MFADDVKFCPVDGDELLADEAFSGVDPDLARGQVVGEYEIENKIGAGGFGTVYSAAHPLIGKRVAVKVLSREYSSNPQMVSRFIAEARAVNQIRHRNIIDIFSFGVLPDKRQYFVMEYLDGVPFDRYLRDRHRLPPSEAIPILRQIARALDAAHAAGIVHRDLKPENVFLGFDEDGTPFPKLLDFGIAKLLDDSTQSGHKTRTGMPIGTPYYMSPEQCRGKGVDHRADIYSFGVMTYEVLTGQLPFSAESVMSVMFMHMNDDPPRASDTCPELPALLDGPIAQMMAKAPDQRPASAAAGLEQLAQAARDAGLEVVVSPVRRPGMPTPAAASGQVVATAGHLTPAEQAAIASAQTMAVPQSVSTPEGTTATPALPANTRASGSTLGLILGAVAVVAAIGVGAAVFALRGSSTAPTHDAHTVSSATASAVAAPGPAPSSEPSASAVAPAAAKQVKLTIQSTPSAVEVFLGDERLGEAPGPFLLERGNDEVELTFKAPGYASKNVEIAPSDDGLVSVTLTRLPTGTASKGSGKKKPGSGEIENPF